jgi:Ca2+-transporting ATPase
VAAARLEEYGPNRPRRAGRPPYLRIAAAQMLDPLVLLLLAAAAISVSIGDTVEAAAIAAIVVLNGVLGFWQEAGAERAIRALSEAFTQQAVVVRDGMERVISAEEVVPGDLVVVAEGDRVPADARIVDGRSLEADESALTGESLPVEKRVEQVSAGTPLAERASMLFAGTAMTRGRARAIVTATAAATELGRIQVLASEAKPPATPLTLRLGRLARQMVVVGVAITLALGAVMLLRGEPLHTAFLTSVAVAVAAVPEGLAATVTAALALGARAMARRGAIVRRLAAIETLGETTVICTDKTGTLTENRIRVAALRPVPGCDERTLLEAAVLASTAREVDGELRGDPIETALLLAAFERGLSREQIAAGKLVCELPFDSDRRRTTLVYDDGTRRLAYTKGAPEVVADLAADGELDEAAVQWAAEGFRVLAVARRGLDPGAPCDESIERGGTLVGVIALSDPLRATTPGAVADARRAGIAVRMLTGDHPATAQTIGRAIGLKNDAIIARATPADKLALVQALQESGEIVAVTGDGVNDAPALRRADVGVAMGMSGTEAAREASAIVLTDDDFATIVAAIGEGRRIGDNIRKFVAFLLSANFGEVLVFAVAVSAGLGVPLAVVQVLLVNLVTDGLPAVALAQDPAEPTTMSSPPRYGGRLFGRAVWWALGGIGVAVGAVTLAAFEIGRTSGIDTAQTMAFATLALSELALVFGMRSASTAAWRLAMNRWLAWSVIGSAAVIAAVVYFPPTQEAFATVALGAWQVAVVTALSLVPVLLVEAAKAGRQHRRPATQPVRTPQPRGLSA